MAKAALKPAPAPAKTVSPAVKDPEGAQPTPKAQKAKKKGRGKLFWIGMLLFAIAAGGTSWVVIGQSSTAAPEAAPQKVEKAPTFLNLDAFTVNLQQEIGEQYLQVTLSVKVSDDGASDAMKLHMPEIRNRLLLLLSSKKPSELLTVPGKVQLAEEILREVKQPVPEALRANVLAVYFTSFVIQ
jgi:flagellar FliL protein